MLQRGNFELLINEIQYGIIQKEPKITKSILNILFLVIVVVVLLAQAPCSFAKHRTVITTDGEIDDMDSFIRFLLYSNEVDIDGLIYSSSMWHWAGDGRGTVATGSRGRGTSYRWCGIDWREYYIDE